MATGLADVENGSLDPLRNLLLIVHCHEAISTHYRELGAVLTLTPLFPLSTVEHGRPKAIRILQTTKAVQ